MFDPEHAVVVEQTFVNHSQCILKIVARGCSNRAKVANQGVFLHADSGAYNNFFVLLFWAACSWPSTCKFQQSLVGLEAMQSILVRGDP